MSNQRRRRIVGHEAAGKLRGNEFCGAWMTYQQLNHLFGVFHSAGMNLFSKDQLGVGIVDAFVKFELWIFARLFNGPSGEAASNFADVFLGIPSVNAEGVKFHQFAAVILVQATFLFFLVWILRIFLRCWPRKSVEAGARLLPHGAFLRQALRRVRVST